MLDIIPTITLNSNNKMSIIFTKNENNQHQTKYIDIEHH